MSPSERRPGDAAPGPAHKTSRRPATDRNQQSATGDRHREANPRPAYDVAVALRRRRAAAQRLAVLDDGRADPLDRRARRDDDAAPVTVRELASWRAAWAHLRHLGYGVDVPAVVVAAGQRERFAARRGAS